MPNLGLLLSPKVEDRDALKDFYEKLPDMVTKAEREIARLGEDPGNKSLIASIFRSLHSIKGDAAMCKVGMAVEIAHPIESLLGLLRSGAIQYTPMLGEVILLALDRLEQATEALANGKRLENLHLIVLVQGLYELGKADAEQLEQAAGDLLESVTGFRPKVVELPTGKAAAAAVKTPVAPYSDSARIAADLRFFRSIALQLESRSELFKGRTDRLLHLALESNKMAGLPVDPLQLEVAVYMHDLGMMLLPEPVWLKVGRLSETEKQLLHTHAGYGAEFLRRMEGWEEAARMVRQHHEMHDGAGYPAGLRGDEICPGAKILAIVDAFEAVTLKNSDRGHTRSVLRAVAEVNACDNQFAPEWIGPFNTVIRHMLEVEQA